MTITSIPASPIRPVASDVTLVCTVELNTLVDVPVTVTIMWTGPARFTINNNAAQLAAGSSSTYTSTTTVRSFGRDESGIYTCLATISSVSSFLRDSMASTSTRVTVGNIMFTLLLHFLYWCCIIIQVNTCILMGLSTLTTVLF